MIRNIGCIMHFLLLENAALITRLSSSHKCSSLVHSKLIFFFFLTVRRSERPPWAKISYRWDQGQIIKWAFQPSLFHPGGEWDCLWRTRIWPLEHFCSHPGAGPTHPPGFPASVGCQDYERLEKQSGPKLSLPSGSSWACGSYSESNECLASFRLLSLQVVWNFL